MKYLVAITLFFTISVCVNAQTSTNVTQPCPCCTDEYRQFDFWIGDWNVTDTTGKTLGTNSITQIQGDCGLQENWKGGQFFTGTSINYYDLTDSTWNQLWIDNQGSTLKLKGNFKGGKMILKGEPLQNLKGNWYYHQITWTKNEDGTVTQQWDMILQENKSIMGTLFYGIYKKKE